MLSSARPVSSNASLVYDSIACARNTDHPLRMYRWLVPIRRSPHVLRPIIVRPPPQSPITFSHIPRSHTNRCLSADLPWATYAPLRPHSLTTQLTSTAPDPLPNRSHPHHRRPKDDSLFHPAPKAKGHRRFLRRYHPHSPPLAFNGLLDRVIRIIHFVR